MGRRDTGRKSPGGKAAGAGRGAKKTGETQVRKDENKQPGRRVKEQRRPRLTRGRVNAIVGVALLALSLFALICIFAPSSAGPVGRGVKTGLAWAVGVGRFAVPFIFMAVGIMAFMRRPETRSGLVALGIIVIAVSFLGILHIHTDTNAMFTADSLSSNGGLVGATVAWPLVKLVGRIGAYIFTVAALVLGIVLAFEEVISGVFKSIRDRGAAVSSESVAENGAAPRKASTSGKKKPAVTKVYPSDPAPAVEVREDSGGQMMMEVGRARGGKYKLPPVSILNRSGDKAFSKQTNDERKRAIESTLHSMDVDARVGKISQGPTVSLFEVEVGTGEKVKRVTELEQDIAYALGSPDIRIYSPIPGRQAIGIEVPNHMRDTVLLGDVIETLGTIKPHNQLTMAVGKDMSGESVALDLAQLPHLLLAGSTGAGKSCCINSLVCCLLFRNRPDELKFIMIDPKFVEFTW